MKSKVLCFDVDNTLYSPTQRLGLQVSENIRAFIMKSNQCSYEECLSVQKRYYEQYGSTLQGLIIEKSIDPKKYLKFIHNVESDLFPRKDNRLRTMLVKIPNRKLVITNSYKDYTIQVLEHLGIIDLFDDIYDVVDMDYKYKCHKGSYDKVMKQAKLCTSNCVMIDDLYENLERAAEVQMSTVLVRPEKKMGTPSYHISSIYELENIISVL